MRDPSTICQYGLNAAFLPEATRRCCFAQCDVPERLGRGQNGCDGVESTKSIASCVQS